MALLLGAGTAQAASCTAAATAEAFGTYDPFAATAAPVSASISVSCSSALSVGIAYSVALSAGGGGSYAARRMSAGGATLAYQLYADLGCTQVWGDGTGGTKTPSDSYALTVLAGSVLAQLTRAYTVYGRIPAGQSGAVPGSYADTVLVTLTY